MLISLLGVGLLLMGVGFNPTPIASGVKYTQNNTTRNEKIEIEKNNVNDHMLPFTLKATNTISANTAVWYQIMNPNVFGQVYLKNYVTKRIANGYTEVGQLTTYTYQANCLNSTSQNWSSTTDTWYDLNYLYQANPSVFDRTSTFTYTAIQLDPYQEQFDTELNITINIFLTDLTLHLGYDPSTGQLTNPTWYDVYLSPQVFSTNRQEFAQYTDLSNWVTSATVYQDIYDTLNTPQMNINKTESNAIVRYNPDGTAFTTGDNRNNRYETLTINIDPTQTNYIFLFMKANIRTPYAIEEDMRHDIEVHTNYNMSSANNFYWFPEPFITGMYVPGAINYEVIDIPGMMWEILSMPFAFISTAFNLTLFPGTPYQVNISNLILMLIGIMVVIWILGRFKKAL